MKIILDIDNNDLFKITTESKYYTNEFRYITWNTTLDVLHTFLTKFGAESIEISEKVEGHIRNEVETSKWIEIQKQRSDYRNSIV